MNTIPGWVGALLVGTITTLGAASMPASATETDAERKHLHAGTCVHYENRARYHARNPEAELETILADSCRRAFISVYGEVHTSPHTRKHALVYLDRLAAFKARVITMNMQRLFGAPGNRSKLSKSRRDPGVRPVSRTGEYLIARDMGVIGAYRAWADVTDFTLATDPADDG